MTNETKRVGHRPIHAGSAGEKILALGAAEDHKRAGREARAVAEKAEERASIVLSESRFYDGLMANIWADIRRRIEQRYRSRVIRSANFWLDTAEPLFVPLLAGFVAISLSRMDVLPALAAELLLFAGIFLVRWRTGAAPTLIALGIAVRYPWIGYPVLLFAVAIVVHFRIRAVGAPFRKNDGAGGFPMTCEVVDATPPARGSEPDGLELRHDQLVGSKLLVQQLGGSQAYIYPPARLGAFTGGQVRPGDAIFRFGTGSGAAPFSWSPERGLALGGLGRLPGMPEEAGPLEHYRDDILRVFQERGRELLPLAHLAREYLACLRPLPGARVEMSRARTALEDLYRMASAWSDLYLPEDTVGALIGSLRLLEKGDAAAPTGLLLEGPPGTGKTEIGRRLAEAAGLTFIATSAAELKSGHVGGTEEKVEALWQRARNEAPAILFLDECDEILPDRMRTDADAFGKSMTAAFLANWGGLQPSERIWVIGTTNRASRIDSAALSRFRERITIGLPDAEARTGALRTLFARYEITHDVDSEVVRITQGMSFRDLDTLAMQIRRDVVARGAAVESAHITEAARRIRGRDGASADRGATWDSLVLDPATLAELRLIVDVLVNAEALRAKGIEPARGALLYGPPGTGKTSIARVIAQESGLSFYAPRPSEMIARHVGETAHLVAQVFDRARERAPVILFLDEVEQIAPVRGTGSAFGDDAVVAMLQEMEGLEQKGARVFVLAATNHPERIDPAVLRRLPEKFEIGLPTRELRERILTLLLTRHVPDGDLRERISVGIAEATEGRSPGDLRDLVERALRYALQRAQAEGDITATLLTEADLLRAVGQLA